MLPRRVPGSGRPISTCSAPRARSSGSAPGWIAWPCTSATTRRCSARPRPKRRRRASRRRDSRCARRRARCSGPISSTRPLSAEDVLTGLWELVWAGEVTNDSWAPLRASRRYELPRPDRAGRRFARTRRTTASPTQGRWSLASALFAGTTDRRALAELLLERQGIVTRDGVRGEGIRGGYGAVYAELRALETLGVCRRGYFVEGLGGAQFALPGAVERLREFRARRGDERSARARRSRPGAAVRSGGAVAASLRARAARVAGAWVVLLDGEAALFVERGGRSLVPLREPDPDGSACPRCARRPRPCGRREATRGRALRRRRRRGDRGHATARRSRVPGGPAPRRAASRAVREERRRSGPRNRRGWPCVLPISTRSCVDSSSARSSCSGASSRGAELPFAFEEHVERRGPSLYEFRPLVRAFVEARGRRCGRARTRGSRSRSSAGSPPPRSSRAHTPARASEDEALFRTVLLGLLIATAEACGGFDWDDGAFEPRVRGVRALALRRAAARTRGRPLIGLSVGCRRARARDPRAPAASRGARVHWPEARGLLPSGFGREPDRLCVLELRGALAAGEKPPDAPAEIADAVERDPAGDLCPAVRRPRSLRDARRPSVRVRPGAVRSPRRRRRASRRASTRSAACRRRGARFARTGRRTPSSRRRWTVGSSRSFRTSRSVRSSCAPRSAAVLGETWPLRTPSCTRRTRDARDEHPRAFRRLHAGEAASPAATMRSDGALVDTVRARDRLTARARARSRAARASERSWAAGRARRRTRFGANPTEPPVRSSPEAYRGLMDEGTSGPRAARADRGARPRRGAGRSVLLAELRALLGRPRRGRGTRR